MEQQILRAIEICKGEKKRRQIVFRTKPEKLKDKVAEMEFVICVLSSILKENGSNTDQVSTN